MKLHGLKSLVNKFSNHGHVGVDIGIHRGAGVSRDTLHGTAKQLINRFVLYFADDVPQCDVDNRQCAGWLWKHPGSKVVEDRLALARIPADQDRHQVA